MIIKVLIDKGKLYIQKTETFQTINLNEYGFDYRKPIKKIENHLFNKNLIKKLSKIINSQRSIFDKLFKSNKVFIGMEAITEKTQIEHFYNFGEIIGKTTNVILKDSIDFKKLKIEEIFEDLHNKHTFNEVKINKSHLR